MNIDIRNYGHYRVTSHGGRAYDLYNRENGSVYSITAAEYRFINLAAASDQDVGEACAVIERDNAIRAYP